MFTVVSDGLRRGSWDSVEPPIDSKLHFSWEVYENLISFGYRFYHKYSQPLFFSLYFSSARPFYYLWMYEKCWIRGKQFRSWPDGAFWSGSTQFAHAWLSEYVSTVIRSNRAPPPTPPPRPWYYWKLNEWKKCMSCLDATEYGVWLGSTLIA